MATEAARGPGLKRQSQRKAPDSADGSRPVTRFTSKTLNTIAKTIGIEVGPSREFNPVDLLYCITLAGNLAEPAPRELSILLRILPPRFTLNPSIAAHFGLTVEGFLEKHRADRALVESVLRPAVEGPIEPPW